MSKHAYKDFCRLTLKEKRLQNISEILNDESKSLDILFENHLSKLDKLTVIDAERKAALENLRVLTTQLQTKRLREKSKSSCRYFTL